MSDSTQPDKHNSSDDETKSRRRRRRRDSNNDTSTQSEDVAAGNSRLRDTSSGPMSTDTDTLPIDTADLSMPDIEVPSSIPSTTVTAVYTASVLGITVGFTGYTLVAYTGGADLAGEFVSTLVGVSFITGLSLLGPVVGFTLGLQTAEETPLTTFGVAAGNGGAAQLLLYLFGTPLLALQGGTGALGIGFIIPAIFVVLQAAVAGVAGAYFSLRRSDRNNTQSAQPAD